MNIFKRIKNKYNYLMDRKYFDSQRKINIDKIEDYKGCKKIVIFSVPVHSNIGDQAQYFCWLNLFRRYYPEYKVIGLPARTTNDEMLERLKSTLTPHDKLYVHSGYLIYDPHPELSFICKVIGTFHGCHITILPQTINLISEKKRKDVSDCFNAHPNLTIVSRDEISLQNAHALFGKCKCLLWPDVVTSLIGDSAFQYDKRKRDGIMFCIRNDGEKYYSDEQIESLKKRFEGVKIVESDTTIVLPKRFWDKHREKLIREIISGFAGYQLIITDRYHGTIFSQIANTPVIVLSSADHKLVSGVKWFPKEYFGENVFFANGLDEAYEQGVNILKRGGNVVKNPTWFRDTYYSKEF